MARVFLIMGSESDKGVVQPCLDLLDGFGIPWRAFISSAHRTPERTQEIVKKAESEGAQVIICAAGMAAHLAGAVAARTLLPVIGIPVLGKALGGVDALYATVQMPAGFPVATVAINGAKNAAWLAAEILALTDRELKQRLGQAREKMREEVERASREFEQGAHEREQPVS